MNRTKIDYVDYSWNPITGCLHGCWYCYAMKLFTRFGRSFKPIFHPERLSQPSKVKKPSRIFACSVSDPFAVWTKPEWRDAMLSEMKKCPWHTFLLLTKQPQNITSDMDLKDYWVGTTVTGEGDLKNIKAISKVKARIRYVSCEPILDFVYSDFKNIDWIIVGKLTGSRKVKLDRRWVTDLIRAARYRGIPIFVKDNVHWDTKIQEFPTFE